MAASSVFQRSSWKFDQLTPTTGPFPWASAPDADRASAAIPMNACFLDNMAFLLGRRFPCARPIVLWHATLLGTHRLKRAIVCSSEEIIIRQTGFFKRQSSHHLVEA